MEKTKNNTNKILKYAAIGIAAAGISASTTNTAKAEGFLQIGVGALFGGYNNCGVSPFYNAYQASVNDYQYGTPYVPFGGVGAFGYNNLGIGYANRNFSIGLNIGSNYYNSYPAAITPYYNAYQASVNNYQYGTPYVGVSPYYNAYQAAVNTYQYGTPYVYTQQPAYNYPVQQNNGPTLSSVPQNNTQANVQAQQPQQQYQQYQYTTQMQTPAKTVILPHSVIVGSYIPSPIVMGRPLSSYNQSALKEPMPASIAASAVPISNAPLYKQYARNVSNSNVTGESLLNNVHSNTVKQVTTTTTTTSKVYVILPAGYSRSKFEKQYGSELNGNAPSNQQMPVLKNNTIPMNSTLNAKPLSLIRKATAQNTLAASTVAAEPLSVATNTHSSNWMNIGLIGAAVGALVVLRKKIYNGITGKSE